jgi:hypothetical protein
MFLHFGGEHAARWVSPAPPLQPAADQLLPPPNPPPPRRDRNAVTGVPLPVIGIWLAEIALAVYILTRRHGGGRFAFPPASPA